MKLQIDGLNYSVADCLHTLEDNIKHDWYYARICECKIYLLKTNKYINY